MTSFAMLPYSVQCILGAAYAFITASLLYILVGAWRERLVRIAVQVFILFAVGLCILQAMTEEMQFYEILVESADSTMPSVKRPIPGRAFLSPLLERIPAFWLPIILLILTGGLYLLRKRFFRAKSSYLTPGAIKENMDHMPVGICYGAADGLPLLVNAQMDKLCAALFGTEILNVNRFWNDLKSFTDPAEVHLSDGTVWEFRHERLPDEDGRWELLAYNITEQYRLGEELAQDNRRQQELNQRLHKFNQEINLVTREDEILRAKIRIHDEIGHALLSYRHYQGQSPEERRPRQMLALWDYIVRVMRREAQEASETADTFWQEFLKKAQALHVQVVLRGDPGASLNGYLNVSSYASVGKRQEKRKKGTGEAAEREATKGEEAKREEAEASDALSLIEVLCRKRDAQENVLCIALLECLTNTVKHGHGNVLYICAWKDPAQKESDRVQIAVYNNGVSPQGNIKETGGLANLRRLAEQQGVEMHIESSPIFLLRLSFVLAQGKDRS